MKLCPLCGKELFFNGTRYICSAPCGITALPAALEQMSALRVQRDEAVALAQKAITEFGALAVEHAKQANGQRDTREVDVVNHVHARGERYDGVYLSGEPGCPPGPRYFALCRIGSSKSGGGFFYAPGAPVSTPHVPFKAGRITADVDKDNVTCLDCLARLRATGVPEATDSRKTVDIGRMLAALDAMNPSTGVPEAELLEAPIIAVGHPYQMDYVPTFDAFKTTQAPVCPFCKKHPQQSRYQEAWCASPECVIYMRNLPRKMWDAIAALSAAPPVAEDADVKLDTFEGAVRRSERGNFISLEDDVRDARAAVGARMTGGITAEALWAELANSWHYTMPTVAVLRAALSALGVK